MRLVDADYIKESVKRQCDNCRKGGMKWMADIVERAIIEELDNTPTAQEHKKGKWIWWYEESFTEHATEYTPHCKCSECGRECAPSVATYSNFCRNCGARMDGDPE